VGLDAALAFMGAVWLQGVLVLVGERVELRGGIWAASGRKYAGGIVVVVTELVARDRGGMLDVVLGSVWSVVQL